MKRFHGNEEQKMVCIKDHHNNKIQKYKIKKNIWPTWTSNGHHQTRQHIPTHNTRWTRKYNQTPETQALQVYSHTITTLTRKHDITTCSHIQYISLYRLLSTLFQIRNNYIYTEIRQITTSHRKLSSNLTARHPRKNTWQNIQRQTRSTNGHNPRQQGFRYNRGVNTALATFYETL